MNSKIPDPGGQLIRYRYGSSRIQIINTGMIPGTYWNAKKTLNSFTWRRKNLLILLAEPVPDRHWRRNQNRL